MDRKYNWRKTLILEDWEIICPRCDGVGYRGESRYTEPNGNLRSYPTNICRKCNGEGKLDWIENVVGKKKPSLKTDWTFEVSNDIKCFHSEEAIEDIIKELREGIVKQIDEEIMEVLKPKKEEIF